MNEKSLIPLIKQGEIISLSGLPGNTKEDIREKKKELFRALFGDVLPEIVEEELRSREEQKKEQARLEEEALQREKLEWLEEYKAQQEDLKRNPYLGMKEVTRILNLSNKTVCRLAKLGKIKGEHEAGFGWSFRQDDILDARNNMSKLINSTMKRIVHRQHFERNLKLLATLDKEDTYMTLEQLRIKEIIPVSSMTIRNWIKKESIKYKITREKTETGERITYYIGINYLRELFADPPPWLARSMKISRGCRPTTTLS